MKVSSKSISTISVPTGAYRHKRMQDNIAGYAFIFMFLIFYIAFMFYPIVHGFYISLCKWDILGSKTFIGVKNYLTLFHDPTFWASLWHTTYFTLLSTPVLVIGGFLMALLVNNLRSSKTSFFRVVFFTPSVLSVSIVSFLWFYILQSYTGLFSSILREIGIRHEIFWLGDTSLVWPAMVLVTCWWTVGYNIILYLAGLQEIPEAYYESARIDGASAWQEVIYITIPSLSRIHKVVIFLQLIASFKIFGQVFLITKGGPAGATMTVIQYLYESGFQKLYMGIGSAAAFVLFFVIFIVSMLQIKMLAKEN